MKKITARTYLKVLGEHGQPVNGGRGQWPLPDGRPGDWLKVEGELLPCRNGLHVCRGVQVLQWLGPIWLVEPRRRTERIEHTDKTVVREARLVSRVQAWTQQTARLFAADCAERVLHGVTDRRSHDAVRAARQYAFGMIDEATRAAAREVAWEAAWAAVGEAVWTAVGAAARATVGEVAGEAAGEAAWKAAREAAWTAARAAAGAAAWNAAAWNAARHWQWRRLCQYLNAEVDLEAIRASVTPDRAKGVENAKL